MKSYLKFLSRNKLYATIEAVGLIVSLAFVILIGSYVRQQWRVAKGAPEWKHYYIVGIDYEKVDFAPKGLHYLIKESLPGVDLATEYTHYLFVNGQLGNYPIESAHGVTVSPDFFQMFPVEWVAGDPASLIGGGVAVSESFADRYSPDQDIMDRIILAGTDTIQVKAVFKSFESKIFPGTELIEVEDNQTFTSIGPSSNTSCIISTMIPEDELVMGLDKLFETHLPKSMGRDKSRRFVNGSIERMDRLYFSELNSDNNFCKGNLSLLRMLAAIVLLLLLSAVFNFINLAAALAGRRAKEMGIRSILGSSRGQILRRYLTESLLFAAVCALLAVLLAYALTPVIQDYIDARHGERVTSVPFTWQWDAISVGILILLVLIVGLPAGWIPARISSRFTPSQIVKGDFRHRSKRFFSKVFIIIQTALAVMLFAFSLVMERQFSHMIHRPLGADADQLYVQWRLSDALDNALDQLPFVSGRGQSLGYPGWALATISVRSKDGNGTYTFAIIQMDPEAFRLCRFEIVEDYHTPLGTGIWLAESTYKRLCQDYGDLNPLPKDIPLFENNFAGIIKDFATSDAAHINPNVMGMLNVQKPTTNAAFNLLKIEGDRKEAEKSLQAIYKRFCEEQYGSLRNDSFNCYIQDAMRRGLVEAERQMRMVELFMILAVLVSLLGLLAMSSFFASEHTHDVAVRKVFGGTVGGEVMRGVGSYMLLVLIACVLAVPVAVWLSGRYLEGFDYRISGYGWIFAVAVAIALIISFLAVLWQTLKAARTNPAVELKKE